MQKFEIIKNNIHDEGYYTFETSWISEELIDFESMCIKLPVINIDVQNANVLKFFNINDHPSIYFDNSYFLFEHVTKIEKNISIHSTDRNRFLTRLTQITEISNSDPESKIFEIGGMGVFIKNTFDGLIKISARTCFFVVPNIEIYRLEHKFMHDFDPFKTDNYK
jgi:hypothetical protein